MNIASAMQGKNHLAKTGDDYVKLIASKADYIARSKADFTALRQAGNGPLAKLPDADFAAFVNGLEFKHGGVAHGSYKPLMGALTMTEIFKVFGYMGMDSTYAFATLDRECSDDTCFDNGLSFCSSNCFQQ